MTVAMTRALVIIVIGSPHSAATRQLEPTCTASSGLRHGLRHRQHRRNAVAPIEVASGEHSRHRLSRAGNRQLNCAVHLIALQQVRHNREGGGDYYRRQIAQGKTAREAMRCLKRRITNKLYRRMLADHRRRSGSGQDGT